MQATYQTRIEGNDEALSAYAALYGRVQRRLFAEVSSGRSAASRSAASMKRGCVREYGIPARMFNAVRVSLEGKVSGARESQLLHAETLKGLVRRAGRELADARKRADRHRVHQKLRRLDNLRSRLARVEADAAAGWSGCASAAGSYGGLSAIWRPTATAVMRSGWPVGGMPGTASSSCWGAGTRPAAASCAWRGLPATAP